MLQPLKKELYCVFLDFIKQQNYILLYTALLS